MVIPMDSQEFCVEPASEAASSPASLKKCISEDVPKNNNVYDKGKEELDEVDNTGAGSVELEEDRDDDEENCDTPSQTPSGSSDDDVIEEHEQVDTEAVTTSSPKSETKIDNQSVEADDTASNGESEKKTSETDSSVEEVVLEEQEKDPASDNHQSIPSANEISLEACEDDKDDKNMKTVSDTGNTSPPVTADEEREKPNELSDVASSERAENERSSAVEDAIKPEPESEKQSSVSSHEDAVPLTEPDSQERHESISTQSSRAEKMAADRDRKNPAYIPRTGKFFMHDEREGDDITLEEFESSWFEKKRQEQEQLERKKGRIRYGFNGDRWGNDKFDERQQSPKTYEQIVSEYGYDIREDGQANRKKYWDSSHRFEREDNREWKRRPRWNGNEGAARGRRSGGRGRANHGPNNRSGPGYKQVVSPYADREQEQRESEEVDPVGNQFHNYERESGNKEKPALPVNRDPASNGSCPEGRGNRPRTSGPKHWREFKGNFERPPPNNRRSRNGQEQDASDDKRPNTRAPAETTPVHNSQSSATGNSVLNNASPSSTDPALPRATVFVDTNASSTSVVQSTDSSAKVSSVNSAKEAAQPSPAKSDETRKVAPAQAAPDAAPSSAPKAPPGSGYPSNKRYSAQRRERKFDREIVPSNARRPHGHQQQSRQQVPNISQASHVRPSSAQQQDSLGHQKHLVQLQKRTPQLPPQSSDSQPPQQPPPPPPPLPMSQLPQQTALRPDVGTLPPQMNYQSMHGGLEYPPPHASVIPSMSQQELTYFGPPPPPPPPPTSVHPHYLLNYFRAIPADPNLQFFAQQQVAAAAAALANGQFPAGAGPPPSGPPEAHYQAPENTGGAVFYSPLAQQQQQQPQLTPERPRRALPIVAPSAGIDS